ncbi:MAG: helix-turn-helix domain-containing protein [Campylobacteraceae bacterium]|nr:helix-turn-helix domain-containing protein [Campylobacteraceae bacterium]
MAEMTVAEASEILGITKEAIYNRIRRGTLNSTTKNGIKYVTITNPNKTETSITNSLVQDDRYIKLLESELSEQKVKNQKLEADKERLIDEKEALLRESKSEIERIYKDRDKQLNTILALFSRPALTSTTPKAANSSFETIDADFEELSPYEKEMISSTDSKQWINLHLHLKRKGTSSKKQRKIINAIASKIGVSLDVKEENGILYFASDKKLKTILTKN